MVRFAPKMATVPISQFRPMYGRVLNPWGDPLYGVRKEDITDDLAKRGLDYNFRLYAPDSPEIRAQFMPPPVSGPSYPAASTGWERPDMARLNRVLGQYGSNGRPGYASVSFPKPAAPSAVAPAAPVTPPIASSGTPVSPALNPPAAPANPNLDMQQSSGLDSDWTPAVNAGAPESLTNNALGDANVQPDLPQPVLQTRSPSAQTTRYYDRKFGRQSRDPVERMQSRIIDGRAPNVSYVPKPVQFKNSASDWVAY